MTALALTWDQITALSARMRGFFGGYQCGAVWIRHGAESRCQVTYVATLDHTALTAIDSPRHLIHRAMSCAGWYFDMEKPICPTCWDQYGAVKNLQLEVGNGDERTWAWMERAARQHDEMIRIAERRMFR